LAADAADNTYALDGPTSSLYKFTTPGGGSIRVIGTGSAGNGADGGSDLATAGGLALNGTVAAGVALDQDGHLFVGDQTNVKLRMVPAVTIVGGRYNFATDMAAGKLFTIDGSIVNTLSPRAIGIDASRNAFYLDNRTVFKLAPNGTKSTVGSVFPTSALQGLTVDRSGNIYVSQLANVFMYPVVGGTYFGTPLAAGSTNGWQVVPGVGAFTKRSMAVDRLGNLYMTDFLGEALYVLDAVSGTRYRVAGTGSGGTTLAAGGTPTSGVLTGIIGIAASTIGKVYFTTGNKVWRMP
ncbi:MAG: hypothetical protein H7338_13625, partial [Candidatus Sericytochromatia bacterium]|nr:hypothetical protein [Candidatus Sericytochromatia bacterium]